MRKLTAVLLATVVLVSACGDDDAATETTAAPATTAAPSTTEPAPTTEAPATTAASETTMASAAASIETCEELADETIAMIQGLIDAFGALTPEELSEVMGGTFTPEFAALVDLGADLGTRGQELACADIDRLVTDRAEQLEAAPENAMGHLIIEGVKTGEDVLSRLLR